MQTGLGLRAGLGAAVRLWKLQILIDGAYERFFPPNRYSDDAVLVAGRVAWQF